MKNTKNSFIFLFALTTSMLSVSGLAGQTDCVQDPTDTRTSEKCYQLSLRREATSRTPERLCILTDYANKSYSVMLKTGFPTLKTIATFEYDLLKHTYSSTTNDDVYGVANPSNSSFNALAIQFQGKIDANFQEEGTVKIGATEFFYRSL